MAPTNRIIIDTDPGVDDILAMLLAFASQPDEIEVLLLSVVFGNIDVESCLRNVVSMFHVIDRELAWRRQHGRVEGFESLKAFRPLVAVGMEKPLADQLMMADYFHGIDGLGGIHSSHPHFTPQETWKMLFQPPPADASTAEKAAARELASPTTLMKASQQPAHQEILRLLRENEPDTITIVAIGPLTNLALAAAEDVETFLRVKEVVVMGGVIDIEGNVSPVAEFNLFADSVAAARVFALTSPLPSSTLPPHPPPTSSSSAFSSSKPLPDYPPHLSRQLHLTLFTLDLTTLHVLHQPEFEAQVQPLLAQGSPLAEWVTAFMRSTFDKIESLHHPPSPRPTTKTHISLALHDPLCIWYILTSSPSPSAQKRTQWTLSARSPEDIRIETTGQWTRGMCILDRRLTRRRVATTSSPDELLPGDHDGWLNDARGNRVHRVVEWVGGTGDGATTNEDDDDDDASRTFFGRVLLERIFG